MRNALLIVVALLGAAGCDDPAVTDKITSVLAHGIVQAHARCEAQPNTVDSCSIGWGIKSDLFQDGTSISTGYLSTGESFTNFGVLGDSACACRRNWSASAFVDGPCVCLNADGFSLLTPSGTTACGRTNPYVRTIDEACVGFNLDAFEAIGAE